MLLIVMGLGAMAQQKIQLSSADKAECVSSDMTSLRASFSFSTIEAEDYKSDRGTGSAFPTLSLAAMWVTPRFPSLISLSPCLSVVPHASKSRVIALRITVLLTTT